MSPTPKPISHCPLALKSMADAPVAAPISMPTANSNVRTLFIFRLPSCYNYRAGPEILRAPCAGEKFCFAFRRAGTPPKDAKSPETRRTGRVSGPKYRDSRRNGWNLR